MKGVATLWYQNQQNQILKYNDLYYRMRDNGSRRDNTIFWISYMPFFCYFLTSWSISGVMLGSLQLLFLRFQDTTADHNKLITLSRFLLFNLIVYFGSFELSISYVILSCLSMKFLFLVKRLLSWSVMDNIFLLCRTFLVNYIFILSIQLPHIFSYEINSLICIALIFIIFNSNYFEFLAYPYPVDQITIHYLSYCWISIILFKIYDIFQDFSTPYSSFMILARTILVLQFLLKLLRASKERSEVISYIAFIIASIYIYYEYHFHIFIYVYLFILLIIIIGSRDANTGELLLTQVYKKKKNAVELLQELMMERPGFRLRRNLIRED